MSETISKESKQILDIHGVEFISIDQKDQFVTIEKTLDHESIRNHLDALFSPVSSKD